MAEPEFRLIGAALHLGNFTAAELARAAGTGLNTTRSWIGRNGNFLVAETAPQGVERMDARPAGRPPSTWRLRPGSVSPLRQRLDGLVPRDVEPNESSLRRTGQTRAIPEAELHQAARDRAQRVGDAEGEARAERAARGWVRVAWEDYAARDAAGEMLNTEEFTRIAKLECQVGGGAVPNVGLRELAGWAAQRLRTMIERSASANFAAQVLRARAAVRDLRTCARLSAASLGAAVWADEGLAETEGVLVEDLQACAHITASVPASVLLAELDMAIDRRPSYGFCTASEQGQAIVLGLAQRMRTPRNEASAMRNWLCYLTRSNDWLDALAPPVAFGLGFAGSLDLPTAWAPLRPALDAACKEALTWTFTPGRLRRDALDYARTVAGEGGVRRQKTRREDELKSIGDSFALRPSFETGT